MPSLIWRRPLAAVRGLQSGAFGRRRSPSSPRTSAMIMRRSMRASWRQRSKNAAGSGSVSAVVARIAASPSFMPRLVLCYSWLPRTQGRRMLGDTLNEVRWQGKAHRGVYEVYYLTLVDPATGDGYWFRYTLDVRLRGYGEPELGLRAF